MPATTTRSQRQLLTAGPFKGVRDSIEPFDDTGDFATDATNMFIPNLAAGSHMLGRAGFTLLNNGSPVYTGRGQCVYTHLAVDGTVYPFIVGGGKLYRANAALNAFTDVTPVGVTIDATHIVKMVSLGDDLVVSDGVHAPWIGSNLSATPITGTYIQYDAASSAWSAQDITVWGGSIVAILKKVAGAARQSDISWSEPGTPADGWQQLDFDNNWTLEQTGSSPLFAVVGTNIGLYYFRQRSIGAISGAIGPDLATTSTHDSISFNVGTRTPQSIQVFGNFIYFVDTQGRPYRLQLGEKPEPIWLNMRGVLVNVPTTFPAINEQLASSVFESQLNLYLVSPWASDAATQAPPVEMYQFDGALGMYGGRWNIKGPTGIAIECMGNLLDAYGGSRMCVLGSKDYAPATGGYVWGFNAVTVESGSHLTTEGSAPRTILTTESGLRFTTEGQPVNWTDDGFLPEYSVTTSRLGYSAESFWSVDRVTAICASKDPVQIEMISSAAPTVDIGVATPGISGDETWRFVAGCKVGGRGIQVKVRPTTTSTQWGMDRVQILATVSQARPEDA